MALDPRPVPTPPTETPARPWPRRSRQNTFHPTRCSASLPRPLTSSVTAIAGGKQAFKRFGQCLAFGRCEETAYLHLPAAGRKPDPLAIGEQAHPVRMG